HEDEEVDPDAPAAEGKERATDDLDDLPDNQRSKARAETSEFVFPELVQGERVLVFEVAAERLPGRFEIVEFGVGHEVCRLSLLICPRTRCLRRLSLVAPLVPLLPTTPPIPPPPSPPPSPRPHPPPPRPPPPPTPPPP